MNDDDRRRLIADYLDKVVGYASLAKAHMRDEREQAKYVGAVGDCFHRLCELVPDVGLEA